MKHAEVLHDVEEIKNHMGVWSTKRHNQHNCEPIRLLDLAELEGGEWGKRLILQVMCYQKFEWHTFIPPTRAARNLTSWYSFIRRELEWDGRIIVSVSGPNKIEGEGETK